MVLEVIYVVRHGYRSNWTVNPTTGDYQSTVRTPTGIPSDPPLASYGVKQSEQLATHLSTLNPKPDIILSSPYYRCLQTLNPYCQHLASSNNDQPAQVTIEPGLGEFYGKANFEHPGPAMLEELSKHFDFDLSSSEHGTSIVPSRYGEGIDQLHDRVAYALSQIIRRADSDPSRPKGILLCTHAAVVIALGRVLTGRMPEDVGEEDFSCFTCGVSEFRRKQSRSRQEGEGGESWDPEKPDEVPDVVWRVGKGVEGGWTCERNSDCSFLENGEERGWTFSMETQRIQRLEAERLAAATSTAQPLTPMTSAGFIL